MNNCRCGKVPMKNSGRQRYPQQRGVSLQQRTEQHTSNEPVRSNVAVSDDMDRRALKAGAPPAVALRATAVREERAREESIILVEEVRATNCRADCRAQLTVLCRTADRRRTKVRHWKQRYRHPETNFIQKSSPSKK